MVPTAAIAVGGYILGRVSSVHGVTLRPLLTAKARIRRADLPRLGCGAGDAAGPVASLAATPDGCAPPARPRRPQELRISGASFPRRPLPRRVAEGSAPRKGTAEQGKIQPPAMGPAHLHGVILCFCNRSASAPRSLSCSLAPSLSCWLPVLGSQRAGGRGDAQHRGERLRMLVSRVLKSTLRGG